MKLDKLIIGLLNAYGGTWQFAVIAFTRACLKVDGKLRALSRRFLGLYYRVRKLAIRAKDTLAPGGVIEYPVKFMGETVAVTEIADRTPHNLLVHLRAGKPRRILARAQAAVQKELARRAELRKRKKSKKRKGVK